VKYSAKYTPPLCHKRVKTPCFVRVIGGKDSVRHLSLYPHYIAKAEKKGRTKQEVDELIFWLTGYDAEGLQAVLDNKTTIETFFAAAPQMNPNAVKITGVICGDRVEEIKDKVIQQVRWLDKLIDELAKGKAMEKILRA